MDHDTRVGAYAVLVRDERLLLAHWVAEPGLQAGWTLPGGGLEFGESPEQAAVREAREETGYEVELTRILGFDSEHITAEERATGRPRRSLHSLRVIYEARIIGGELSVEVEGSTDDVRWAALAEVSTLHRVRLVDAALTLWRAANGGNVGHPEADETKTVAPIARH